LLNLARRLLFDRRLRVWRVAASALLVAAVCWLATRPWHEKPPSLGWDKGDHLLAFGGMAFVLFFTLQRRPWPAVATLALCLAVGIAIEVAQLYVPGRRAEAMDVVADMSGAVFGLGLAWLARRLLERRSKSRTEPT
jgi:VanZ family protein